MTIETEQAIVPSEHLTQFIQMLELCEIDHSIQMNTVGDTIVEIIGLDQVFFVFDEDHMLSKIMNDMEVL